MRKLSTFVLILSLAAMLAACGESEPAPGAPAGQVPSARPSRPVAPSR